MSEVIKHKTFHVTSNPAVARDAVTLLDGVVSEGGGGRREGLQRGH